ncbi:sensor histidine kinase [Streptomyces sp. NPDC046928]|uniref:sensor histidine kinase n=1 Tax=Streptomyces sp. NPDC046928 TaxID=3155021 RepID=UPI0033FE648F
MGRGTGKQDGGSAAVSGDELPPRAARLLWYASAGLVLGVLGTAVLVAGAGQGRPLPVAVAVALVLVQVCALRWQARAPLPVLTVGAVTGVGVWALLPEVSLTGALLAAQITLCVLSASRPRRVSVPALAVLCLSSTTAFANGGPADLAVCVPAMILAWTAGQWRRARQERLRAETRRAVVEERARIAREVHDVVAHTLSVMVVQAGAADDVFTDRPEQAREALRAMESAGRSALGELRMLLRAFGPEGDEGAVAGQRAPVPSLARLDDLADAVRASGMRVRMLTEGVTDDLPASVRLAAYRIVQEALTNTLRHSVGADEVSVRVTTGRDCVTIDVTDNGRTAKGSAPAARGGRGLLGMRERAQLVGGSVHAGPLPGGGFQVTARLPVEVVS